ncbi:MAG: transporter [Ferruginibacter sp.]|nr:transporter [Ferruginibacter sp.]
MKIITRTVWILSLVSLFTDMASEMLYPVMPLFLQQIGYSALFIGILEGFAEAIAGLTKSYFGKQSDRLGKRLPFVQLGYGLSTISKPMLAIFIYPWWIFLSRTIDRLGKGLRTGARDAMLSDESVPATRGRIFGFHRSMDTMGAVLGPGIALAWLYFYPGNYRELFLLAFVPGLFAIGASFMIREKQMTAAKQIPSPRFFAFASYWKKSPDAYKKLVRGLLVFALINSSDVFLLLKLKQNAVPDAQIIAMYIFYNLCYAILAYPIGILADRLGIRKVFLFGLSLFVIVYAGFAFAGNMIAYLALFALYGCYAAATEGVSKAWISKVVPAREIASAIGSYSGFQSICALLASSLCGFTWVAFGAVFSFCFSALICLAVIIYFYLQKTDTAEILPDNN